MVIEGGNYIYVIKGIFNWYISLEAFGALCALQSHDIIIFIIVILTKSEQEIMPTNHIAETMSPDQNLELEYWTIINLCTSVTRYHYFYYCQFRTRDYDQSHCRNHVT